MNKQRLTIGVLLNQIDAYFEQMSVLGISDAAKEYDFNLIVFSLSFQCTPDLMSRQNGKIYQMAASHRLDGLIIFTGSISYIIGKDKLDKVIDSAGSIPVVSVGMRIEDCPSIVCDNAMGVRELVTHLIEDHHFRRIGFIQGPEENQDAEERYISYIETLANKGIPIDSSIIFKGGFQSKKSYQAIDRYLQKNELDMEAIVAANDEMLIGVCQALEKNGISVPKDIAVAGFDDVESMKLFAPPVTTVRQPFYEMGKKAAEKLMAKIAGKEVIMLEKLPAKVVIRKSCGCLASGIRYQPTDLFIRELDLNQSNYEEKMIDYIASSITGRLMLDEQKQELSKVYMRHLMTAFKNDVKNPNGPKTFIQMLKSAMSEMAGYPHGNEIWEVTYYFMKTVILEVYKETEYYDTALDLLDRTQSLIDLVAHEGKIRAELYQEKKAWVLRDINHGIMSSSNLDELASHIQERLPALGIRGCSIGLYNKADICSAARNLPETIKLYLALDAAGSMMVNGEDQRYPTLSILPDSHFPADQRYFWLVEPLLFGEKQFGIIVFPVEYEYIHYYGALQEQISLALNNIMLLDDKDRDEEKLMTAYKLLEKSEEYFRDMVVLLPVVILETDLKGNFMFLNQAGREAFGFNDNRDITQESLYDFIQDKDKQRLIDFCESILSNKESSYHEFQLIKQEGTKISLLNQAKPIFQMGKAIGFRWSAVNIQPFISNAISPDNEFFKKYNFRARHREILELMLKGMKSKEIAEKLFISEGTVKFHISSIYHEIGVKNKKEMMDVIRENQIQRFGYEPFFLSVISNIIRD